MIRANRRHPSASLLAWVVLGCLTAGLGTFVWMVVSYGIPPTYFILGPPQAGEICYGYDGTTCPPNWIPLPGLLAHFPLIPLVSLVVGASTIVLALKRNAARQIFLGISGGLLFTIANGLNGLYIGGWPLVWYFQTRGPISIIISNFFLDWVFWSIILTSLILLVRWYHLNRSRVLESR